MSTFIGMGVNKESSKNIDVIETLKRQVEVLSSEKTELEKQVKKLTETKKNKKDDKASE